MRRVLVPFERMAGWFDRFDAAHPDTAWDYGATEVTAAAPDGTAVSADVPYGELTGLTRAGLLAHLERPWQVGIVIVRRGGFAVVRLAGAEAVETKIGRRHVQGRTKAGGWSQQRFARRRDNQARAAFDAAGEAVRRILAPESHSTLDVLATGGDRQAVAQALERPELAALPELPQLWLGGLPDPNRAVVDQAIASARSVRLEIVDPPTG
jgi:hypothetical protein